MVFISFVAFCLNVENLGNSRTSSKSFSLPGLSFTAQWSGFGVIDVPVLFLRGLWLCRWLSSQSFLRWWDSRYSIKKLIPTKSHLAVLGTLTITVSVVTRYVRETFVHFLILYHRAHARFVLDIFPIIGDFSLCTLNKYSSFKWDNMLYHLTACVSTCITFAPEQLRNREK